MPICISAGVDDHPCFLTFYYYCMIPIDSKLLIFTYTFLLDFGKDSHNYFLAHTQALISEKPVTQYTSYSLIFNPLRCIINGKQHERYPYNQSSHYGKYGMFDR